MRIVVRRVMLGVSMFAAGTKRTVHICWSSRAMFVLACSGATIGFKNFWQFPSLVYDHGGGAFLIVYFFFLVVLGLPLLSAEFMIGRLGRDAPDGAFRRAAALVRANRYWWLVGAMAVLGGFLIFSYLSVIAGWTIAFGFRAATGAIAGLTADGVSSVFTLLVKDLEKQVFWYTLFIVSVAVVSARGLRAGPEPVIRYAVPTMFGLMLLLLGYAASNVGFPRAVWEAFTPDFGKLSWTGVLAAAAHAFFSLSLGAGAMFMYGAYLERDAPLARLTWYVVALDALAGLAAMLTVYAVLYSGDVGPATDMALLFQALPLAFDHLSWGRIYLSAFFVSLIIAAWLSGLALFEPGVMWLVERFDWSRPRAAFGCGVVAWVLASAVALSFNAWAFSFPFLDGTKKFGLFDIMQILTSHGLLPLVGIGTALFAGWALRPDLAREQLHLRSPCAFDAWLWSVRIVIPVTLLCVMFQLFKPA